MTGFRFPRPISPFALSSTGRGRSQWRLGTLVVTALVALLVSGPALAASRSGTNGNDTLVGTSGNDQITGKAGSDTLKGRAGNDTYFFANNFSLNADLSLGHDTLVERANEGIDTVNFHAVRDAPVSVRLVPSWLSVDPDFNAATGPSGEVLFVFEANGALVQSTVENAIGGQGDGDRIVGGGGKNIIQPGGGAADELGDIGGWNDGSAGNPEIAASNDIYKDFADNTGTDTIADYGGEKDVLDMRPFSIEDVAINAIDFDLNGTVESLQIVTSATSQVIVLGQFGDVFDQEAKSNLHGQIETIRFADAAFSTASALRNLAITSTEAPSGKQAELAAAADGLAKEARALTDPSDLLRLPSTASKRIAASGTDTPRADQHQKLDKHAKSQPQHPHHDRS